MNDSILTSEQRQQIIDAILAGRKIEAIKIYRDSTNQGLKESKEFIEAITAELVEKHPELMAQSQKSGCGTAVLLLLIATIYSLC